jgi:ankyrin repeat protein
MDPDSIICDDLYNGTVILAAVEYDHYNIVKLLLECGASNCKIFDYISPLKKAADSNNYTICELLLDHGAHPDGDEIDILNKPTPLYYALYYRRADICKLLISRGATTSKDVVGHEVDFINLILESYLADILRQMSE